MSVDHYISFEHDDAESQTRRNKGEKGEKGSQAPAAQDGFGKQAWNKQFRSFRLMAMPFFQQERGSQASLFLISVLAVVNSAVGVLFSYLGNYFWTALGDQNAEEFYRVLLWLCGALVCLAPINVLYRFMRQRLAIHWREWMTSRTLLLYYNSRVYYRLEYGTSAMDNPDQRIAEDIRSFTESSLSFFLVILNSFLDLLCFSVILFLIRPQLFLAIIAFATAGTAVTWLIGKKLIILNFIKLQREADFRFALVRIRENAESIAFYKGEHIEAKSVGRRFGSVIDNMHDVNVAQRNLDFFTTPCAYLVWIIPLVVVAPEYFAGNVTLGVVQQSAVAFGHVLNDLSLIIYQFDSLSELAASIDRLYQFFCAVQAADGRNEKASLLDVPTSTTQVSSSSSSSLTQSRISLCTPPTPSSDGLPAHATTPVPATALSIWNLTLYTPDFSRSLISNLTISLHWGRGLLIMGNSGIGKSSLLRAIAGLWTSGSGTIERPNDMNVCFLPQRPYCVLGSLRDQLLYPHADRNVDDDELLSILTAVDLMEVATRAGNGNADLGLDAVLDWSNILSLGEQQRLAFGRILSNKPALVVADECTSALDVESENKMYSLLRHQKLTYVSVGHRPSLEAHHDFKLTLKGREGYAMGPIIP